MPTYDLSTCCCCPFHAWWKMDDASFGTRLDSLGTGVNLLDVNSNILSVAGHDGNAASLNGTYASSSTLQWFQTTGPLPALSNATQLGIRFWIKKNGAPDSGNPLQWIFHRGDINIDINVFSEMEVAFVDSLNRTYDAFLNVGAWLFDNAWHKVVVNFRITNPNPVQVLIDDVDRSSGLVPSGYTGPWGPLIRGASTSTPIAIGLLPPSSNQLVALLDDYEYKQCSNF